MDYDERQWVGQAMSTSAFAAIPGGWFTMGTDHGQEDERPPHRVLVESVDLAVFRLRAEYERFVNATGQTVSDLLELLWRGIDRASRGIRPTICTFARL
jgi:formylglycine-generating enzyme required for sulfatase activity